MKPVTALTLVICLMSSPIPQAVQRSGQPTDPTWARVGKLLPGTEIRLTTRRAKAATRYFLAVDDSALVVLNLVPSLSAFAKSALLDVASNHPEYFTNEQAGGTFASDRYVRIESGAVFVADQEVGDLGQMVERIARLDVVKVQTAGLSRGAKIAIGTAVAAAVAVVLSLFRARYCNEHRC